MVTLKRMFFKINTTQEALMTTLSVASPSFRVNDDEAWGRILVGGQSSEPYYSKREAIGGLKDCLSKNIFNSSTGELVFQQIKNSSLPESLSLAMTVAVLRKFTESLQAEAAYRFNEVHRILLETIPPDYAGEEVPDTLTPPPGTTLH